MSRNWCFTLNNWSWEEFDILVELDYNYIILGFETGEQGTDHIQGFIQLIKKIELTAWKKINNRLHLEAMRGTPLEASNYCKKDGIFFEDGIMSYSGKRNDIIDVKKEAAENGMRGVLNNPYNYQCIRIAEKYLSYCENIRDWKPNVIWITGEPGTGKSRLALSKALENFDKDEIYTKSDGSKWFTGYDAHKCVILDDFRDSWMSLTDFLTLIDRYERIVEQKGSSRQFLAQTIFITSIFRPEALYKEAKGEPKEQILRRIDEIITVKKVAKVGGNTGPLPKENTIYL